MKQTLSTTVQVSVPTWRHVKDSCSNEIMSTNVHVLIRSEERADEPTSDASCSLFLLAVRQRQRSYVSSMSVSFLFVVAHSQGLYPSGPCPRADPVLTALRLSYQKYMKLRIEENVSFMSSLSFSKPPTRTFSARLHDRAAMSDSSTQCHRTRIALAHLLASHPGNAATSKSRIVQEQQATSDCVPSGQRSCKLRFGDFVRVIHAFLSFVCLF
jgi:hypothetical protein